MTKPIRAKTDPRRDARLARRPAGAALPPLADAELEAVSGGKADMKSFHFTVKIDNASP